MQPLQPGAGVGGPHVEAAELERVAQHEPHAGEHARVRHGYVEQPVVVARVEDVAEPQGGLALRADREGLARLFRRDLRVDAALRLLALRRREHRLQEEVAALLQVLPLLRRQRALRSNADARLGRGRFVGRRCAVPIAGRPGVSRCFPTGGLQFNGCLVCRARVAGRARPAHINARGAASVLVRGALAVRPLCRQDSAPLTAAALRCCRCSAEREGAANANRCNPGYEFEAYSAECGGGEGCVSVRPCATGVTAEIPHTCRNGYTYIPNLPISAQCPTGCIDQFQQCDPYPNTGFSAGAQRVCMQNGQPALQYTVGMCQDAGVSLFGQTTTTVPNPEGCYFASTPRSCDRTPTAGPAAGHISDQAQASPRKFNGGGDYVMISQNKLGTYCDVTIDTWIKFGANALAQDQCPTLGAGWVRGSGNIAYDCPGAVRKSTATLIARTHPPLDTSPDRSSDAASWLRCCGRIWAMSTVSIRKQLRRSAAKCR